jgi:hypothetical protein
MQEASLDFYFSHDLDDEIFHLEGQLKQIPLFEEYGYEVIWPESLRKEISLGASAFTRERLREAIKAHELPGANLAEVEAGWRAIEAEINTQFISKLDVEMPKFVRVHATMFGPGGCHNGAPMLPILTVGYPQMKNFNFNKVLVHELIEVFVFRRFKEELQKNPKIHPIKEAVVDKFCGCNELVKILGPYPKQKFGDLPADWRSWLPTKQPNDLTWAD